MKTKKILLINSGYHLAVWPRRQPVPPFGLLSISASLEKSGFEVILKDFEFLNLRETKRELQDIVYKKGEYLFFGIGLLTGPGLKKSFRIMEILSKNFNSVKIVAGGPHATIFYRELLESAPVDIVCMGESEKTIVDLAEHIDEGKPLNKVKGIAIKENGVIFKSLEREMIDDISALPMYCWEKIGLKKYIWDDSLTALYSRGCPHRCTFCLSKKFLGRIPRSTGIDAVINDMLTLKERHGIKKFRIADDLPFGGSIGLLKEFSQKMIDRQTGIKWKIWGRIDSLTPEIAGLLKNSGCEEIHFGVESGSQRILDMIKKDINISSVKEKIEMCRKFGMECSASFIVGFPFEEKDDLIKTRKLIRELRRRGVICTAHRLTPFPSTEMWDICADKGLRIPKTLKDWENYGRQINLFSSLIKLNAGAKRVIWKIGIDQFVWRCFNAFNKLLGIKPKKKRIL